MTLTSIVVAAVVMVVALALGALVRNRRGRRTARRKMRREMGLADARQRPSTPLDREAPIAMSREAGTGDGSDGNRRRPTPRPRPDQPQ